MKHLPKTGFPAFLFCLLFLVCACNMKGEYSGPAPSYPLSMEQRSMAQDLSYGESASRPGETSLPSRLLGTENVPQTRKLVKQAELRLRVDDPAATEKPLAALMEKYSAWPASAGIYENSRSYSIRVPSPSFDAMLAELAGFGRMLGRTENTEDVTLRYYDLESRLATKRELLKTFQGYLGRAKDIDEIMTVESRIADLQQEIDQTGTQFRNLASLVDYSTINVEFSGPVSTVSYSEPTLGEKLGELFGAFRDVASSALVILTGIIIYGVPAILVLILLFWLLFGRIGLLKKLLYLAAGKK